MGYPNRRLVTKWVACRTLDSAARPVAAAFAHPSRTTAKNQQGPLILVHNANHPRHGERRSNFGGRLPWCVRPGSHARGPSIV
jgi:hypothetical protein